MRYNSSGYYEEKLSLFGLETKFVPLNEKNEPDFEKNESFLNAAFEQGVTFFFVPFSAEETAKKLFRTFFGKKNRDDYFLGSGLDFNSVSSEKDILDIFKKQLSDLGTGFFDYYVIENLSDENISVFEKKEILACLSNLKKSGKIKHLGFSFCGNINSGKSFLESYRWDFVKMDLSYYNWDFLGADSFYRAVKRKKLPFIAFDPFMGNLLKKPPEEALEILKKCAPDYSPEEWALRWFFDKKGLLSVVAKVHEPEEVLLLTDIISSPKTLNPEKKHCIKLASQKIFEKNCEGTANKNSASAI